MVDMRGKAVKVHRSLLQRDLLLGVPAMGLVLVFSMFLIFLYLFQLYFMVVPIALFYVLMRHFTSKDPWFIEILLESILQKDVFLP